MIAGLRRLLAAALALCVLAAPRLALACADGGCVTAGPRLAGVSSTQSPLLNALLGSLTGTALTVSAADWNAVAVGNVSMNNTLAALQATLVAANTQTALNTPITLNQLSGALGTAASQAGNTGLALALGNVGTALNMPGTIKLGDLVTSDGIVGNTNVNALSLLTGAIQLFNYQNVATTPTPITVSGASLGLGASLTNVAISAQVVEAPVYVCGPVGSAFHTAAIRVKLGMTLVSLNPSSTTLNVISLGSSVTLGNLPIYVEVGHAAGAISLVNALAGTMSVQVTPGVASLYLGNLDTTFFDRSHAIVAASDLTPAKVGTVSILGLTIDVLAKAAAVGAAPYASTLAFSGATPQTLTATTGGSFASTLVTSLFGNLSISLGTSLGLGVGTDNTLSSLLVPIVSGALSPVLTSLTTTLVNPLLSMLGIRLGEVDVTAGGEYLDCAISGCVYTDLNHNLRQDSGEAGTGATLYAKAIPTATPSVATAVVSVDPSTGNYAFPHLNVGTYTVVVNASATTTTVTGAPPAGWIGTETPTQSRAATLATADLVKQNFGLFHGGTLAGALFKDTGTGGGGVANNGVRDGTETALGGVTVNATDATGATLYDSQPSDAAGAYVLWIPHTANGIALKVAQAADPALVVVAGKPGTTGGTFTLASASVGLSFASGSAYTGVNFGDVPINRLDTDGQQSAAPGTTALYAHAFHAGSAGQVTFSAAAATTPPTGWSATVYLDVNCNGQLDTGDTLLTAATAVIADQTLCVVVKVFVPLTATNEMRTTYQLTSSFAYANNTLTGSVQRQDLTIVGTADDLRLVKTVDKTTALSGDVITYTLTFVNQGAAAVSGLKLRDTTPAWTVLNAAACGTMPSGISACSVSATPAVGASGSVEWTLTGALPSGGTGSVQFSVKVQ